MTIATLTIQSDTEEKRSVQIQNVPDGGEAKITSFASLLEACGLFKHWIVSVDFSQQSTESADRVIDFTQVPVNGWDGIAFAL